MRKTEEQANPASCFNQALPQEMTFVLLGRDEAAPAVIRAWCAERIRLGKNLQSDQQIIEAQGCATRMDLERAHVRHALGFLKEIQHLG